ncbi:nucleotidyltransferase substrate binding protein [Oceanobacillus rekensis]|uniref:nucleotidyltransferase substrate binding protein n=1 Tax=Oceanobacillus rekensis TaxID=937927 RepID=UPI000B43E9AD
MREALAYGIIEDGEQWIDMMIDCNKTSLLYDEAEARLIYEKIKSNYNNLPLQFGHSIEEKINKSK